MLALDVAYAEAKSRLLDMIGGLDGSAWVTTVPATPAWDVLATVAHVTGLAVEAANSKFPTDLNLLEQFRDPDVVAARDAIADGQVSQRRGASPAAIVSEWDAAEPRLLDQLRGGAPGVEPLPFGIDTVLVTDLCVHAADMAYALGRTPDLDGAAAKVALAAYSFGVDYRIRALGLSALVLRYEGKERTLGEKPPAALVAADRWELLRVLAGRWSRAQISSLDWTGDPEPYLAILPAYGERLDALVE